jgi:DNA-binding NtrC family response regulator
MKPDILLVDDDVDGAELLSELLRARGYPVRWAANGVAGLHLIDERFPQVVVSDVDMPVLDGPAMVYRLFVENLGRENIPLILVSGRSDLPQIADAVGTPYFVEKPFDLGDLVSTIHRAATEAIPPKPAHYVAVEPPA